MDILKITAAIVFCFAFLFLLWTIKGWLLRPVIGGKDSRLTVTVPVKGAAPELEQIISGLLWLKKNGTLNADILIVDEGLEQETAQLARLLSKDDMSVQVCSPDQIEYFIRRSCDDG